MLYLLSGFFVEKATLHLLRTPQKLEKSSKLVPNASALAGAFISLRHSR
jgi:hypothetical protein